MQNQNQDKPNYDQYSQEIDLVDVDVAGGLVAGILLGCFTVFFLELYAKAKIRAAETA
jgi:hypothetical protein